VSREPLIEKAELQLPVMDGDGISIVWVIRLAPQLERRAGVQSGDDVLTSFERDAREFGMKTRSIGDRCVRIVQVLVALREDAFDEGVRFSRHRHVGRSLP
jgi:hypothetical protein